MNQHTLSPIDTVRAFMSAMEAMDFDAGLQLVAADCEYTNGPLGTVNGPAAIAAMLQPFFAPIRENTFVMRRQACDGATVFIERLDRHRLDSGWIELPVTGVFEVRDGRIAVWHDYFDLPTIEKQLAAAAGV